MAMLEHGAVNLAVLRGVCSAEPEVRELASGSRLATLSLRVPAEGARSTSVPVCVWEPPAWIEELEAGDELVVVGHVRRRFFRTAGAAPGARVEVVARHVVRASNGRGARAAISRVRRRLDDLVA
ncbi:MAG: single-stranded DNA-binding protein [Acidimicrobiia bacterium]